MDNNITFNHYKAAIFDLDGTLIHSEHVWEAAKVEVLGRYGITPTKDLLDAFVGRGLADFFTALPEAPLPKEIKTDIANQIGAYADIHLPRLRTPVEGASELLKSLHREGLHIAICSSSPRRYIESAMADLKIENYVKAVISGAELPRGKPDPLPFATTLQALDIAPHEACAFEDSLPGARSAHDAGMPVFAVGEGCTGPAFSFCHHRTESFLELTKTIRA
ncbi:HAD family hydrolase [Cohaesibacter gelatinilyticus]|uniref:Sugar-phosphatase n=1 Tax=Cohaesibacter gelatinilyticus TaxID=372072 RepID=A0A285PIY1_9HYPH|nr:HAD family phosphatase [Cohaesibacter gelatinilyticus]SNZ21217.1 sugar-phosphatase [Cohaesibacter gelatinilyticus]